MTRRSAPEHCANCGAAIPPSARACPECGADERTGWAEQDIYDGLDLPEDDETQERNNRSHQNRQTNRWFWLYVAIVLILLLTLGALGLR
ncbi:MAG: zinc ribbon domain-containing protein [Verrucomicrobia bacterium]|nr:zinc ribbon domain-containing protein [Verrucomicrobiota bacterium]